MKIRSCCFALSAAVSASVSAAPGLAQELLSAPVSYSCARGAMVHAVYVNVPDAPGHVVLYAEGQMIVLHGMPAASGVLYGTGEGQPGYRWRTQGDDAMMGYVSDSGGDEETLLRACQAAKR